MYYISHMLTHFLGLRNINFLTLVPTFVSILELQKLSTCVLKNILGTKLDVKFIGDFWLGEFFGNAEIFCT